MNIAQVTCSLTSGGAEKIAAELGQYMKRRNHSADVIILDRFSGNAYENQIIKKLNRAGVAVYSMGRKPGSYFSTIVAVIRMAWFFKKKKYAIVNSHLRLTHFMVALARYLNLNTFKQVITIHSSIESWLPLSKRLNKKAHVVLCGAQAKDISKNVASKKLIENGVFLPSPKLDAAEKERLRKKYGCGQNSWLVLSVGNLIDRKNYNLAIDVMERLKRERTDWDWRYLICGEGPQKDSLSDYIAEKKLEGSVHLLGARSDIGDLHFCADCFLSTSKAEGLPLSVIEACMAGTPCVLSPIDAHKAISTEIAGVIMPEENEVKPVADALTGVRTQSVNRETLIEQRKIPLDKYSFNNMARAYEAFYHEVLESPLV
jgi:glycosyltransferase involved in cell wall biosynthesis